jgi:hypothetical protein
MFEWEQRSLDPGNKKRWRKEERELRSLEVRGLNFNFYLKQSDPKAERSSNEMLLSEGLLGFRDV